MCGAHRISGTIYFSQKCTVHPKIKWSVKTTSSKSSACKSKILNVEVDFSNILCSSKRKGK